MMTILERYIGKTILLATGMAVLVISGVLFLMAMLGELKNIGDGDYGITQAVVYVMMHMPISLYQFAPMLILLGSIAGLSILSSHKELAVMRAAGFSVQRIIYCVLFAGFILTIVFGLIGEMVAPKMSYRAEINKENARNAGQAVITASGVWLHVDNNFIHIKQVVNHDLLEDVTRYEFDGTHKLLAAYHAKSLSLQDNQWMMHDAVKTSFYDDRTKSESLPLSEWTLKFNTNLLNMGHVDPSNMTLTKLARFTRYLEKNGLQANQYRYEYWQRIFQPLASLIMIFLAIPFVLGALSTSTLGWRMIVGILVGFAFFISNSFLGQVCIVYQIPPMLAAFLPLVLFGGIGIILSKQLIKQ